MLKFITVLTITLLSEDGKDYGVQVPYKSEEDCKEAIGPVYEAFVDYFPDAVGRCVVTGMLSESPRPRKKPVRLGGTP